MRIDLTVRDPGGNDRDVAVVARAPVPLGDVVDLDPALRDAVAAGARLWSGSRELTPADPVPGPGLRTGSVIRIGDPDRDDGASGTARSLDVVCGPDAGRSIPLPRGLSSVGRAPECTLALTDPTVSRHHAELAVTCGGVSVRDLCSTHGSSVEGVALDRDGRSLPPGALLRIGDSLLVLSDPARVQADGTTARAVPAGGRRRPAQLATDAEGRLRVQPVRRTTGDPPVDVVVLPERSGGDHPTPVAWVAALLPAVAGAALAAALHSPQFLVLALLSPVIMLGTALGDRLHWRRRRRRDAAAYRRREDAAHHAVRDGLSAEASARLADHPDPVTVGRIVELPSTRLWDRGRDDHDALAVRVGIGAMPSRLRARRGESVAPAGMLDAVPLVVGLRDGPVGVVGPTAPALGLARWMVAQLAAHHSPEDLDLVLLLSPASAPAWTWARWLPHVRTVLADAEASGEILRSLTARCAPGRDGRPVVLVVDRRGQPLPPELSALLTVGAAQTTGLDGRSVPVRSAVLVQRDDRALPAWCSTVVRPDPGSATGVELVRADGAVLGRATADRVSTAWAQALARALGPLADVRATGGRSLPDSCRLLDVVGLPDVSGDAVGTRWSGADGGAATGIGVGADGTVVLDLVRDGPHALVAGTTGSGKSELLQSLVVGLALAHPPDELAFVLVDYKGGAAFGAAAAVPHVVGLVTDLDSRLTARALASLDAELRRRERLLASVGAGDLDSYRRGGGEPVPRLVLVVDEFAALVDDLPQFVDGLVDLAQRGRSLGLHLVLATQRPGGVVSPEIRANTTLRLALRMVDPGDSSDVVGTTAAAEIDRATPGRSLLRIGQTLQEVQTGYLGAPAAAGGPVVTLTPLDAWRRPRPVDAPDAGVRTDLDVAVDAIRDAAGRSGRCAGPAPWLPPLPRLLPRAALGDSAASTLLRIGLVDLPSAQEQPPLELDLLAGGSLLLAGAPRSGRTTALLTVAGAAADALPPDRLHLHVVDGAGGLGRLAHLPHMLSMLRRDDACRVERLLERLEAEARRRRARPVAAGVLGSPDRPGVGTSAHPAAPCMLVLIDGWESVCAAADDGTGRVAERLGALLAACESVGITVVVATDRSGLVSRATAQVTTRLLLRLSDPADYLASGVPAAAVPSSPPPGRAVRLPAAAEVQLAHLGGSPDAQAADTDLAAATARHEGTAAAPPEALRVRPLPDRVSLAEARRTGGAQPGLLLLGVGGDAATALGVDPADRLRLLVAGPARSGRSTVLEVLLRQTCSARIPTAVVAPEGSPLCAVAAELEVPPLGADTEPLPEVLLVDDWEALADGPWAPRVAQAVGSAGTGTPRVVVLSGRTDELLMGYRGPVAELRRHRQALLLQPGPGDGELVGLRLPPGRVVTLPGRGLLIGDRAWGPAFSAGPLPVQVALP